MKSITLLISAALLASTAAFAQVTTVTCSTSGGTNCNAVIPDAVESTPGVVTSTINVPASCNTFPSLLANVAVDLDLLHDNVGDLRVRVIGPSAQTATLVDRPVTGGDCGSDDIDALFSGSGTAFPCNVTNPASGPGPVAPVTSLGVFNTAPVAGTWTLEVTDFSNTGIGAINDWALVVTCGTYPTVTITATDPNAIESTGDPMTFTVTRSALSPDPSVASAPLTVFFTLTGTATSADYTPNPTSVVIPAGQLSATVVLTPTADATSEQPETVIATITANPNYQVGTPSSATGTITEGFEVPLFSPTTMALALVALAIAGVFAMRSHFTA